MPPQFVQSFCSRAPGWVWGRGPLGRDPATKCYLQSTFTITHSLPGFLQYYYSYFTRFLQYCHVCNTVPSICKCCLENFTSMESTRWCWELFHFNLRLLNSSTSQQTQLRPPAFSSESLLTWQLLMKNCAPSNAFDILPNFEPILNGPVRCVRQCGKPLFVHHLQCFSSNPVAAFSLQFH